MKYSESNVHEKILKALDEMGFVDMTPIQERAIPVLQSGKDIIGQAQTGTGKTASFGIPMIESIDKKCNGIQGLVLCPTRELAIQVAEEIRKLADQSNESGNQIRKIAEDIESTSAITAESVKEAEGMVLEQARALERTVSVFGTIHESVVALTYHYSFF